jgi:hypothetical protein
MAGSPVPPPQNWRHNPDWRRNPNWRHNTSFGNIGEAEGFPAQQAPTNFQVTSLWAAYHSQAVANQMIVNRMAANQMAAMMGPPLHINRGQLSGSRRPLDSVPPRINDYEVAGLPAPAATRPTTAAGDFDGAITSCVICMEDFAHGDLAARLGCRHCFHKSCYRSLLDVPVPRRGASPAKPECPVCRGAEPIVATFTYRGPDTYDEAEKNFAAAAEALARAFELLDEARARNVELQGAVEVTQAELLASQRSYRVSREEVWELEDELRAVVAKLRATYAAHAEQGRQQQLRAILGQVGGKVGRLARDPAVSLCTVAYSLVARLTKLSKLFRSQRARSDRALAAVEADQAAAVATLRKAVAAIKVERDEEATLRKRAGEAEASARQESAGKDALVERLTGDQAVAAQRIEALHKQLDQAVRKVARSKEKSAKLFQEKADAHADLARTEAERNEAVKQLGRQRRPCCSVCLNPEEDLLALLPCGHACVCRACEVAVDLCPLCRDTIAGTARVFLCSE